MTLGITAKEAEELTTSRGRRTLCSGNEYSGYDAYLSYSPSATTPLAHIDTYGDTRVEVPRLPLVDGGPIVIKNTDITGSHVARILGSGDIIVVHEAAQDPVA